MSDWRGKKVVVVGAARQGLALARYLVRHGARVVLNDKRTVDELNDARQALAEYPIEWVLGDHPFSLLDGASLVCLSGGVSPTMPLVQEAYRRGLMLSNDSQIFLEESPCRVIGITGSAGKTTTTTLVGRIASAMVEMGLDKLGSTLPKRVWVGGNIGAPLIENVDEMQADDLAVMELSSFQLELMTVSPQVAAVLNITPNHLDRHGTMTAYVAAKARILAFQKPGDAAVLCRDEPGSWLLREIVPGGLFSFGLSPLPAGQSGAFMQGADLCLRLAGEQGWRESPIMPRSAISLRGEHNLLNVLAACTICAAAGIPVEAMRAGVEGFGGVPHRLEYIRTWGGADWYNDSIATAPERSLAAIRSFDEPLVLLAGGRDKDLPWETFGETVRRRVDHLILFGEASEKILRAVEVAPITEERTEPLTITRCTTLRQAVEAAARIVQPGDVVLLSPGGTSFDEFKDFEERGICFAHWVNELT